MACHLIHQNSNLLDNGNDEIIKSCTNYTSDSGTIIDTKHVVKDLGILISDDCKFDLHIDQVAENVKKLCAWILRTFESRSPQLMITLWKSLAIPRIEYCSQLWSPHRTGLIQKIEIIQWSFLRKIKTNYRCNYWELLAELKLYSLERRRERYRIIYIWKILEKLVPNIADSKKHMIQSKITSRHGRKCIISSIDGRASTSLKNIRYGSFSHHGGRLFNFIPKSIRCITGCHVENFKKMLDKYLALVPDEPQIPGLTRNRRCESNSILDMGKLVDITKLEGGNPLSP